MSPDPSLCVLHTVSDRCYGTERVWLARLSGEGRGGGGVLYYQHFLQLYVYEIIMVVIIHLVYCTSLCLVAADK